MDPVRYLSHTDVAQNRPVHAVWELTLACDLKCCHCGSRAGRKRREELSTVEAIGLVGQLAELGVREVTLIGGEAYLRKDWGQIISAVVKAGMLCSLQTGGRSLTEARVGEAVAAGLGTVGVSIDGLCELHDRLRGVRGSFEAAFAALRRFQARGVATSVTTQITREVIPQLPELCDLLIAAKVRNWQVQLTVAMGRAADNEHLLVQPYQMLELMPLLSDLFQKGARSGLLVQPGNNIGYFGPYEGLLRGSGNEMVHYRGCFAGRNVIGIEADGTIKGCPSLATDTFGGGNIRDKSLKEIWQHAPPMSFARRLTRADLWGFCASCYYADVCKGGCTWTSHALLGRAGNNPYCHHRAIELAKDGRRERVVKVASAPGRSFDRARFEIVMEATDERSIEGSCRTNGPQNRGAAPAAGSPERRLDVCRGCKRHVFSGTVKCPFCGGTLRALADHYAQRLEIARRAKLRLQAAIQSIVS
jgi:radical SAM protein with 4Fe4S-binding SPASM domain